MVSRALASGLWLTIGLIGGLMVAQLWPQKTVQAVATDRDAQFAITTVPTGNEQPDAVFVLDFLTGRLTGGLMNPQTAAFTNFYVANVAVDFDIDPSVKPKFAIIPGQGYIPNKGGLQVASGLFYVAELNSGVVLAYSFPFKISRAPINTPVALKPIAKFPFRAREIDPNK